MSYACPECGGLIFLRALRRESFGPPRLPWALPSVTQQGYLASCENCSLSVKVTREGLTRFRPNVNRTAPPPPTEPEEDAEVRRRGEAHATPGMLWTREAR